MHVVITTSHVHYLEPLHWEMGINDNFFQNLFM
jgi:hypothetical protein